jgi:hypothetical protein
VGVDAAGADGFDADAGARVVEGSAFGRADDAELRRAVGGSAGEAVNAVLTLEAVASFVLVPASVASLATGLMQSLGNRWGRFRRYWVLIKLVMNVGAIAVLLLYLRMLASLANVARTNAEPAVLRDPSPTATVSPPRYSCWSPRSCRSTSRAV